jgi:hypothetical protein
VTQSSSHYEFRSEWHLAADPDEVYTTLQDVAQYPAWWPQVVRAAWLDDSSGELVVHSTLPYELKVVLHREREDPHARVLRARISGDMTGASQWTVTASGSGTVAVFDEDVEMRKRIMRAAGLLARPALRLNHDLMMRSGEKGLRRHLAG